jgi:glutamine amidotransferase
LDITPAGRSIRDFGGLRPDTSYYFVHSYGANPLHESDFYASVLYGGQNVCAVAGKENIQGVQFHPEKSAKAGLKVLESFLAI